jgi:FkbM family methyltransferase
MQKPVEVNTNLYRRLKEYGVQLHNIIDVGCHQGAWTTKLKLIYPEANYYLIDPNNQYEKKLNVLGTFYQEVVGQTKEKRSFNFSNLKRDSTGNSLYDENSNTPFNKRTITTKPLQDIVPDQTYELIKMDVQGAELEIIEGSLKLFQKTKFVQLECPVHHNNKGAPLFEHYINYMANSNFKVFDIDTVFYNNKLMAIDFLFVNKKLPIVTNLESNHLNYAHHPVK